MPQSLANVLIHLVFSTKERQTFLSDFSVAEEMHRYLAGISKDLACPPVRVGGTEDHVHILARLGRTLNLADWIKELKRGSSVWIKTKAEALQDFSWQAGYGAFSVSQSQCDKVERYIANQAEHHRTRTFQEEFRTLLNKHRVDYDERYAWD